MADWAPKQLPRRHVALETRRPTRRDAPLRARARQLRAQQCAADPASAGAHRPDGISLAAARHFHNQLHVGVVVAVGAAGHADELVSEADVPARAQEARQSSARGDSGALWSEPRATTQRGVPLHCGRAHAVQLRRPRARRPLCRAALRRSLARRVQCVCTHSALAATSSGVAMATKCSTPSRRKVWYAQRRIERMHLAAPTAGGEAGGREASVAPQSPASRFAAGAAHARPLLAIRILRMGREPPWAATQSASSLGVLPILSCEAGAPRLRVSCVLARAGRRGRGRCARRRRRARPARRSGRARQAASRGLSCC